MRNRVYDNQLRAAARAGSIPEQVMEYNDLKEKWDEIVAQLVNEEAERKAGAELLEPDDEPEEASMQELRKGPAHFVLHSDKCWRAVANQTVRSYVTLLPEPKTQAAVQQLFVKAH